nr:hypothetical protein [Tanacetum cinerariifolium]
MSKIILPRLINRAGDRWNLRRELRHVQAKGAQVFGQRWQRALVELICSFFVASWRGVVHLIIHTQQGNI